MITTKEVAEKLKKILDELKVEYSKILLFGSRSMSDFDEESDWDFLIILKKSMDLEEKKNFGIKFTRNSMNISLLYQLI